VTYFQTTLKKDSMKSLLTSASMITVGVFVFFACQKSSIPPKEGFRDCYTCKQDEFYGLTVDEFMEGVARYKNTHANLVNADPYMKKVDVKPEDLGIRFYYAVYPSTGPVLNGSNYKSLHTLFMVPTVTGADSIPVDFDPRYSAGVRDGGKEDAQDTGKRDTKQSPKDTKAKYYTITQLDKNVKLLMLESETAASATTTSMAKNQGQLCPPTCNGSTSNTLQQADASHPGVKYN
jgi:hypothetical protein